MLACPRGLIDVRMSTVRLQLPDEDSAKAPRTPGEQGRRSEARQFLNSVRLLYRETIRVQMGEPDWQAGDHIRVGWALRHKRNKGERVGGTSGSAPGSPETVST